jgi:hypothetical protein
VVDGVDRVMSADSHILEPHDLWQVRIERQYRDRAPRLVREQTTDRLACDDVQLQLVGFLVGAGRKGEQSRPEGRWEEVLPAGYDPEARLGATELDGIDAEILFPTTASGPSFGPTTLGWQRSSARRIPTDTKASLSSTTRRCPKRWPS